MNELRSQTQHPNESLIEYIRSMPELIQRVIPDASKVEKAARVIWQCHPRCSAYIHRHTYPMLKELARQARCIKECILAWPIHTVLRYPLLFIKGCTVDPFTNRIHVEPIRNSEKL